jgi:signal transduction histidine kinase/CheY-like chemotaxis protein
MQSSSAAHAAQVVGVVPVASLAPLLVAGAAGALSLVALLLWWRRREPLQGIVGGGLLVWGLYLAATAAPPGAMWPAFVARAQLDPAGVVPLAALLLLAAWVVRRLILRVLGQLRTLQFQNAELHERIAAQTAELLQAIDHMRESRDGARAADQAKTRFLAAASHDLRQPAHALGLYMAALRETPLSLEQTDIAQRMGASLAALDSMFAALLDVSRIDAGAVLPQWDLLPLAPLLRRLADESAPQAEARGLRLSLRLAADDAMTVSDGLLLERILRNLLANAVKYTARGGVLLACRLRLQSDGTKAWRIEVWDTGVGISDRDSERVFEEFVQIPHVGREGLDAPGLGLGLAIVRRLVHLLQLRLVIRSVPGRGSVFMVEGLAAAGALPQRAAAARGQMRRLAGTLVAVIEDDEQVRDAMRRVLLLWECQVVDGGDADALLQRARHLGLADAVPHALIADVRLADGRRGPDEAAALFKAWGRSVPMLLVSGDAEPGELLGNAAGTPFVPCQAGVARAASRMA